MKVLVTGGTGFIASYVVRRLVEEGHDVVVFDLFPFYDSVEDILTKIKVVKGDVTRFDQIVRTIRAFDVNLIIHTAYMFTYDCQMDPLAATRVNCEGTVNVFEAARLMEVKKVVWASSVAVYGSSEDYPPGPIDEDAPMKPQTIYGACKVYNEHLAHHYRSEFGLDNVGLRFPAVYGPGMERRRTSVMNFLFDLFEGGALGRPCAVMSGDTLMNWQYVKDAANAILLASEVKNTKHIVFNVGGFKHTVREVAMLVKEMVPEAEIEVKSKASDMFYYKNELSDFDLSRAQDELGYRPHYSLREGIRETVNVFRQRSGLDPV